MKTQTGIWIDGSKALVIAFREGKETILEIPSKIENSVHHRHQGDKGSFMGHRHINNERKFEEIKRHEEAQFIDKVLTEVKDSDELFVMGSSEMKKGLKARIEADKHLKPRLKGYQATDHLTLNQCVAEVKKFYGI